VLEVGSWEVFGYRPSDSISIRQRNQRQEIRRLAG
jgi:hypothetical protein